MYERSHGPWVNIQLTLNSSINNSLFLPENDCFIKNNIISTLFKTFYIEEIGVIVILYELKTPPIDSALPLRCVCPWQGTSGVLLYLKS